LNPSDPPLEAPFDAPWQAQVFGLTVALHEQGVFDWPVWAQTLGAELRNTDVYWDAWLAALESVLVARGLAESGQIAALAEQWQDAAHATPHGEPILLENAARLST